MQFQIVKETSVDHRSGYDNSESNTANAGAMVHISGNIDVDTKNSDGEFFAKLKVSTLRGQSLFFNEFTSNSALNGCVYFLKYYGLGF